MFINIEIRKTRNTYDSLFWFRYETFYHLFEFKVFQHEERETQFLSMLTFPSDPTTCGTPPQITGLGSTSSEKQLPSSSVESLLPVFFSNSKILCPSLPGLTSFTSPVLFSIWGFYCDICDCHIHPTRVWTPALNVCTKLTYALSRKVLSLTKPKGKIYKTKNDNIKKNPFAII